MNPQLSILLVEDEEADVLLLRRAFREVALENPLHVAHDGQEAIDFLTQRSRVNDDRVPALIILDLKLPRRTGMDVLQWIRDQPVFCTLPVIVFSSSAHRSDVERAYTLGANAFIVKPPSTAQRRELARFFKEWLALNQPPLASTEGFQVAQSLHANG